MRVLIVPNYAAAAREMRALLEERWFAVTVAGDGEHGLARLLHGGYEIAIVDEDAWKREGVAVVREARGAGVRSFIVMLGSNGSALQRAAALHAGADDYLLKPVANAELVARMNALARRTLLRAERHSIEVGALRVDVSAHSASYGGCSLCLSATELRVLACLADHAGQVFSRAHLIQRVWRRDLDATTNAVDVCVGSLRRKLASAGAARAIVTVRGRGYKLVGDA